MRNDPLLNIGRGSLALVAGLAALGFGAALADEGRPGGAAGGITVERLVPVEAPAAGWRARSGDDLVAVLSAWGHRAGWTVVVEQNANWKFTVPFASGGGFREAVDAVLAGFSSAGSPPVVIFYTNNVMTIGVR
ncbi:toxin co-regulated pilus biosynthesis Q family protein [Cereibacter sphaeroides]|uniref:TcpQ domain-containing protein n=1 Tax=Cereibacter sphaeroides TaxID=1063 RepID=UPI001F44657E|nr:TcpQ domain-containing protein [Cereibacter sphaeroides]MCE6959724.1 toxin co-regulated pilus biosynthesis Q family protein [Cereibacter sphaeroides]MCE6974415.1 toxin co-regulated pilus biosynthesis Q family protein [Cereibacter sphaeroides]